MPGLSSSGLNLGSLCRVQLPLLALFYEDIPCGLLTQGLVWGPREAVAGPFRVGTGVEEFTAEHSR